MRAAEPPEQATTARKRSRAPAENLTASELSPETLEQLRQIDDAPVVEEEEHVAMVVEYEAMEVDRDEDEDAYDGCLWSDEEEHDDGGLRAMEMNEDNAD